MTEQEYYQTTQGAAAAELAAKIGGLDIEARVRNYLSGLLGGEAIRSGAPGAFADGCFLRASGAEGRSEGKVRVFRFLFEMRTALYEQAVRAAAVLTGNCPAYSRENLLKIEAAPASIHARTHLGRNKYTVEISFTIHTDNGAADVPSAVDPIDGERNAGKIITIERVENFLIDTIRGRLPSLAPAGLYFRGYAHPGIVGSHVVSVYSEEPTDSPSGRKFILRYLVSGFERNKVCADVSEVRSLLPLLNLPADGFTVFSIYSDGLTIDRTELNGFTVWTMELQMSLCAGIA